MRREDGDGWLFEGKEKANIWIEAGEDDVSFFTEIVDFGENRVDEGIEFYSVGVHALLFAFVEHRILCVDH